MGGNINIELGSVLEYAERRVRAFFGSDPETLDWRQRLSRRQKIAHEQSQSIQIVGMDRPLPIDQIYQPVKIFTSQQARLDIAKIRTIEIWDLIRQKIDAVILAGPGRGKSTLLAWVFTRLLQNDNYAPFLFLLRAPDSVVDLSEFVRLLSTGRAKHLDVKQRVILLVDGYDEVGEDERKEVSAVLTEFKTTGLGNVYLTCRTFYDVYDLRASHYSLADFTEDDAVRFVDTFAKAYEVDVSGQQLLQELRKRDFLDFARHPLMLTLICILKYGPLPELPHNAIDLLKRCFDTLTLRWDQSRGVRRHTAIPLDGEERVRCLMRIAFMMHGLIEDQNAMEAYTRRHLSLKQRSSVDPRQLLREIAQWYGVLVPTPDDRWQFSHRSIHDYLAARFWVESNQFNPGKVRVWNSRAAYAACLSHDATDSIARMLDASPNLHAFAECLYNDAPFNTHVVSMAVISRFVKRRPFTYQRSGKWITVETNEDFFSLVSSDFLLKLLETALNGETDAHDVVAAYCIAEFKHRAERIPAGWLTRKVRDAFPSEGFVFQIGIMEPTLVKLHQVLAGG